MEIFILDMVFGALLVLGMLISMSGAWIWRYRGGAGPALMAMSGLAMTATSLVVLAGYAIGFDVGPAVIAAGLVLSLAFMAAAAASWGMRR